MDQEIEVMVNLEEPELRVISSIYKDNVHNPFVTNLIENCLRIKDMMRGYPIKFYSPLRLWKDNGTFFAVIEYETVMEIGIFTLLPEVSDTFQDCIFTGLNWSGLINLESTKRTIVLKEFHPGLQPIINRCINRKPLFNIDRKVYFNIYKVQREEASQYEIKVPDDVEIKPLDAIHSFAIQGNWPHPYPSSEEYVRTLIDVNGGYGIFKKTNDQLLSWGVKTMMGQIGYVQTIEDFYRKGYASLIVKTFAKELAAEGLNPVAIVGVDDVNSHNFFENLSFRNIGICCNYHLSVRTDQVASASTSSRTGKYRALGAGTSSRRQ